MSKPPARGAAGAKQRTRPTKEQVAPAAGWPAWVAAGLIAIGSLGVADTWVEDRLALRFMFVFAMLAAGSGPLAVLVYRSLRDRGASGEGERLRPAALCGALFGAWAVVCAIVSSYPARQLSGRLAAGDRRPFAVSLASAWALGVTAGSAGARIITQTLRLVVLVNAAIAVLQVTLGDGLYGSRSPGLWGNPVYFGGLLAAGAWLFVQPATTDVRWAAALGLVAAAVDLSGDRAGLVVLAVVAVGGIALCGLRQSRLIIASLVLGVLAGLAVSAVGGATSQSGTTRVATATSEGIRPRLEMWAASAHAVASAPVVGVGPGLYREATSPRRTLKMAKSEGPDRAFSDAHNIVIDYAVTTGLPGAVLLVLFSLAVALLAGWRSPLAGFGLLVLASHLLQPNHPVLTALAFLSLGAAAATSVRLPSVATALAGGLGAAALVGGIVLTVGAASIASLHGTVASVRAETRTGRQLLGPWGIAFDRSARTEALIAAHTRDPADYRRALAYEEEAVRREPAQTAYLVYAGSLQAAIGRPIDAEASFRRALREDPWSTAALAGLGQVLVSEGHKAEALAAFDKALLVTPTDATLRSLRATAL